MKPAQRVRIETDEDMLRSVKGVIADGEPRLLERDGIVVARILPPDPDDVQTYAGGDIWKDYDAEKLRHAVREVGPVFRTVNTDQLKRDIHEARAEEPTDHLA